MKADQRIANLRRLDRERCATPDGRAATLQLIDREVDALAVEMNERPFQAFSANEPLEVAVLTAGELEQLSVRAAWIVVDGTVRQSQKVGLAPREARRQDRPRDLCGQRWAQARAQPPEKAHPGRELLERETPAEQAPARCSACHQPGSCARSESNSAAVAAAPSSLTGAAAAVHHAGAGGHDRAAVPLGDQRGWRALGSRRAVRCPPSGMRERLPRVEAAVEEPDLRRVAVAERPDAGALDERPDPRPEGLLVGPALRRRSRHPHEHLVSPPLDPGTRRPRRHPHGQDNHTDGPRPPMP